MRVEEEIGRCILEVSLHNGFKWERHHQSARLGSKRGWRSRLSVDMLWILPWIGPLPGH